MELRQKDIAMIQSFFLGSLHDRKVRLIKEDSQAVPLHRAVLVHWREVFDAALRVKDDISIQCDIGTADSFYDDKSIRRSLREFIYHSTEAFDLYTSTVVNILKNGRSEQEVKLIKGFLNSASKRRKHVAMLCNALKHDHKTLATCKFVSEKDGASTIVFRIDDIRNGVQSPDCIIHNREKHFTIERIMHEVLHGLLKTDFKAAELVQQLPDNSDTEISEKGDTSVDIRKLIRLMSIAPTRVSSQEPKQFWGLKCHNDRICLDRISGRVIGEPTRRTMTTIPDETALSVKLFV